MGWDWVGKGWCEQNFPGRDLWAVLGLPREVDGGVPPSMARVRKEGAVREYKLRICVTVVRQFRARLENGQSRIQM